MRLRTFTVGARVTGPFRQMGASIMKIALVYDKLDPNAEVEPVVCLMLLSSKAGCNLIFNLNCDHCFN